MQFNLQSPRHARRIIPASDGHLLSSTPEDCIGQYALRLFKPALKDPCLCLLPPYRAGSLLGHSRLDIFVSYAGVGRRTTLYISHDPIPVDLSSVPDRRRPRRSCAQYAVRTHEVVPFRSASSVRLRLAARCTPAPTPDTRLRATRVRSRHCRLTGSCQPTIKYTARADAKWSAQGIHSVRRIGPTAHPLKRSRGRVYAVRRNIPITTDAASSILTKRDRNRNGN